MEYHITGNCANREEIVSLLYIKLEFSLQGIYVFNNYA